MDQDNLLFFNEDEPKDTKKDALTSNGWKILIVDDEDEIHKVTKLVLGNIRFDNKPLQFLHAYSAAESQEILKQNNDIALALIDVVMETDSAGLDLVNWIRKELKNETIRIVLRTGQPGQAPEQHVIEQYDINDYKDKTELTDIKMKTLIYAALRSYRDIITIENSRKGLEKVISATSTIYENFSMQSFASAVLEQISNLLHSDHKSVYAAPVKAMAASHIHDPDHYEVIAATENVYDEMEQNKKEHIPDAITKAFDLALNAKKSMYLDNCFVGYFVTQKGNEHLLYVCPGNNLTPIELHLLEIYSSNVAIALENRNLQQEIESTQRELIYRLGEAVEKRSKETGGHVKRVAKISELLAIKSGLPIDFASNIKLASPLHDIGKIGIPDKILNKPGKFEESEWEIMKGHAQIGFDMLSNSDKPILNLAATISKEHHENWDGSGYPLGLKGEAIDIVGRIVALADVFDALGSHRCYKKPWPLESIINEIRSLSGKKFDPKLVEIFLNDIDEFASFRDQFPD